MTRSIVVCVCTILFACSDPVGAPPPPDASDAGQRQYASDAGPGDAYQVTRRPGTIVESSTPGERVESTATCLRAESAIGLDCEDRSADLVVTDSRRTTREGSCHYRHDGPAGSTLRGQSWITCAR